MANSVRLTQPMPLFVIDTCPSEENQETVKPSKELNPNISRSWSLPNCNETYKDLRGAIHYSFSNRFNNFLTRSRSYPNNYLIKYLKTNDKYFPRHSPSTSINFNMNCLNPNGGTQTPGGSSSRYSLYGSFFDLSESGYYPPTDQQLVKSDNKLLTIDGRPLLILDHSPRLITNTYQDKCNDWLRQLDINST
jgi:hypothetical protein